MKKILIAAALVAVASSASAQVFDGFTNPVTIAGVNYLKDKPIDGSSQARFFLTANVPGFKPFANLPLYFVGVGVDIRTLPGVGDLAGSAGAGVSIPAVTYAFAGKQAVVQVGYSRSFTEASASGIYAGVGFSFAPPGQGKQPAAGTRSFKHKAKLAAKAKKTTELYRVGPEPAR